jgi:DNA-3-methyladenine glycosylase II
MKDNKSLHIFDGHPHKEEILFLSTNDIHLQSLFLKYPNFKPFKRKKGFEGLVQLITEQQLSVASAKAILGRLKKILLVLGPEEFLKVDDHTLQSTGLSRPKINYCRILAESIISGETSFHLIHKMDDENIKKSLCKIKGIGEWTAECYMLASLQRRDIWPAKDLGLQVAVQGLKNLQTRPSEEEMIEIASSWKPYRSIVASILWASYD